MWTLPFTFMGGSAAPAGPSFALRTTGSSVQDFGSQHDYTITGAVPAAGDLLVVGFRTSPKTITVSLLGGAGAGTALVQQAAAVPTSEAATHYIYSLTLPAGVTGYRVAWTEGGANFESRCALYQGMNATQPDNTVSTMQGFFSDPGSIAYTTQSVGAVPFTLLYTNAPFTGQAGTTVVGPTTGSTTGLFLLAGNTQVGAAGPKTHTWTKTDNGGWWATTLPLRAA